MIRSVSQVPVALKMTLIRIATSLDRDGIRNVYLHAFPEEENEIVAQLAVDLLEVESSPEAFSLVAETDGIVIGHVALSPVTAGTKKNWPGYILAPLGVEPGYQQLGIGTRLVESGIEQVTKTGASVLFVYGDPKYYGRFGFSAEAASRFLPPYELKHPDGWQAIVLHEGRANEQAVELSCIAPLCDPSLW